MVKVYTSLQSDDTTAVTALTLALRPVGASPYACAASGRSIAFSQGLDAHAVLARSVVEEAEADSGFGNGHFLPVVYLVEIGSGIRDGCPRDGHDAALLIHIGIQCFGCLQLRAFDGEVSLAPLRGAEQIGPGVADRLHRDGVAASLEFTVRLEFEARLPGFVQGFVAGNLVMVVVRILHRLPRGGDGLCVHIHIHCDDRSGELRLLVRFVDSGRFVAFARRHQREDR